MLVFVSVITVYNKMVCLQYNIWFTVSTVTSYTSQPVPVVILFYIMYSHTVAV